MVDKWLVNNFQQSHRRIVVSLISPLAHHLGSGEGGLLTGPISGTNVNLERSKREAGNTNSA